MSKQYEKDPLGIRMKVYENCSKPFLPLGTIKVIRLDMRAGHTFCRHFNRPFDDIFSGAMIETAKALCKEIPGAKFAYTQSDEISIALNDLYTKDNEDRFSCFFDGNLEKIVSISASIATAAFNKAYHSLVYNKYPDLVTRYMTNQGINSAEPGSYYVKNLFNAQFDSRIFILPNETELHNYFLWRQNDATRNSILSAGYAHFPQSKMDNKNQEQIQNMLHMIGINWNDYPIKYKRGSIIIKEAYIKKTKYTSHKTGEVKEVECLRHRWTDEFPIPILSQAIDFVSYLYNTASVNADTFYTCTREIEINKWLDTENNNKLCYGITLDMNLYEYAYNNRDSVDISIDRYDITRTALGQKIVNFDKNIGQIIVSKSKYNNEYLSLTISAKDDSNISQLTHTMTSTRKSPKEIIFLGKEMNTEYFDKYMDSESKVTTMLSPDNRFRRL
jgi:tRNA(His) 5'-end guanylyltransferase